MNDAALPARFPGVSVVGCNGFAAAARTCATACKSRNELILSAASIWELSIKRSLKRLNFAKPFAEAAKEKGIVVLPVSGEHAAAVEQLPPHHRDPFDHLLIAQTMIEQLVLVTHDRTLAAYNVPMVRV